MFKVKEKNMKKNCLFVLKIIAVFVLLAFGLGISASAATNRYSINIRYGAEKAVIPEYLKAEEKTRGAIISVAEFTDTRQVDDKKIIGQVRERRYNSSCIPEGCYTYQSCR
jgi:ABC-type metal ion transport system substrate-binding protein